jgi:hypothetical protein
MASSTRIILAILGTTGAGLALAIALVFGSLDRLSLRTAEANVDFILTQLRDTIEANVGLGLPLADVRVVQDLIERARAADGQLLAVEVFSPDGVSLFNTDRGSIGESISSDWQRAVRFRLENERWSVEEPGGIVVGQAIRNDFGEPVGYLALTLSGDAREKDAWSVLVAIAERAAFLVPAALLLVLLATTALFDRLDRGLKALAVRLKSASLPPREAPPATELAALADRFRPSVDQAVRDFDEAAQLVLKVDETEDRHAA